MARVTDVSRHHVFVFDHSKHNALVFKSNIHAVSEPFKLLLFSGSFLLIRNLSRLMGSKSPYFCGNCEVFVKSLKKHVCELGICQSCKFRGCSGESNGCEQIQCVFCKRYFHGEGCYENHVCPGASPLFSKTKTVCGTIRRCANCFAEIKCIRWVPTGYKRLCQSETPMWRHQVS